MDILDLKWETTGQNVLCPQIKISARFVDSATQKTTISDYRESKGKQVLFPNIVASLTSEERQILISDIVNSLLTIYKARHLG